MRQINRRIILLGVPIVVLFMAIYVVPLGSAVYYSAIKSALDHTYVGLANYISVWENQYFRLAMINTLRFSMIAIPSITVLSVIMAVILFEMQSPKVIMGVYILPILLPTACVASVFRILFDGDIGVFKSVFDALGIPISTLPEASLLTIFIWKNLGIMLILIIASLSQISASQYEAAQLDGAGGVRTHLYISLPQVLPAILFVAVLSLVYSLRIFREAYLLYGAYPAVSVYLLQHYMNNHFFKLNYQNLTSAAISFAIIICLLLIPVFLTVRRRGDLV